MRDIEKRHRLLPALQIQVDYLFWREVQFPAAIFLGPNPRLFREKRSGCLHRSLVIRVTCSLKMNFVCGIQKFFVLLALSLGAKECPHRLHPGAD